VVSHRGSILVIDDDPSILGLAREVLTDEGYRVVAAPTHDAALALLRSATFDLVLSDTGGADGTGEARWAEPERILAEAGAAPVLVFSAHRADAFDGYRERGFAGVVTKPFDLDELLETVQVVLGGR
jgi:DNA-binding response OmpR family regulator